MKGELERAQVGFEQRTYNLECCSPTVRPDLAKSRHFG